VRAAGKWLLVETGAGDKLDAKKRDIYAVGNGARLPENLEKHSVHPEQIDFVVDTHLHFDHCGWNTRIVNDGAVPTFPNAKYVVQRGELEHAKHPTERDAASYFPENFLPMEDAKQWWLVDGDAEIVPGVEVIKVPGHNADMQCVKLSGGGKSAFLFVDLVPTVNHIPFAWIMGYDLYPLTTLENKKKWIPEVARRGWLGLFSHDPAIPAAYIHERDGKYEVEPVKVD